MFKKINNKDFGKKREPKLKILKGSKKDFNSSKTIKFS